MSVVATDGIRNARGYINMCAVGHGFKRKFDYIIDCELRDFLSISLSLSIQFLLNVKLTAVVVQSREEVRKLMVHRVCNVKCKDRWIRFFGLCAAGCERI